MDDGGVNTRIYVYDSFNTEINRLTVTEGRLPEKAGEILAERENNGTQALSVGDTVSEGDVVAKAAKGLSVNIHAPVSGRVLEVRDRYLVIGPQKALRG